MPTPARRKRVSSAAPSSLRRWTPAPHAGPPSPTRPEPRSGSAVTTPPASAEPAAGAAGRGEGYIHRMALPTGPSSPPAAQTIRWLRRPVELMEDARQRYGDAFTVRFARVG